MKRPNPIEQAELICSIGQRSRNLFWGNISKKISNSNPTSATEILSPTQLQLLHMVTTHGPINITELARIMAVSPPSISVMVDRMVNNGWLHRQRSAQDRRKMMISASTEAKTNITGVQEVVRKEMVNLIKTIGPEITQKWCTVLNAIEKACIQHSR
jgi:DNA-binding MarR family transcriptional regulator